VTNLLKKASQGLTFTFVTDRVTTKVGAKETNSRYSLMTWVAAPQTGSPPHAHSRYDETFFVIEGRLAFVLGDESITLETGDFIRVPAGTRHAFRNDSEKPVEMLVGLIPGGMEELFYKYRTDDREFDVNGFLQEAKQLHGTEYELP
jgi:mannose-6-phosphate isomerase-like protein (cupin superfamily)